MDHMAEFQNGPYGRVSKWTIWQSFKMDHMAEFQKNIIMAEFQNGPYGRVSKWTIWQSFRMEHMAEFQNGNQNLKCVAFPKEANVFICIHTAHGNIMF